MKFYITKYALTKGILEVEGEISTTSFEMINYKIGTWVANCHSPYWYRNRDDAVLHAQKLRDRKVKNLQYQIENLKNLTF